ncbi:class I SAM-dependent methyltransferase [Mesorhizobium sp. B2-6-6]|uniref:class I SAM-dependent methyltransferase n=1 Tax=Mesorhizobium sp. B2-6-6 TaxID=2589911 RepID=UPI003241BDF0
MISRTSSQATANSAGPSKGWRAPPNGRRCARCFPTSAACESSISVAASAGSAAGLLNTGAKEVLGLDLSEKMLARARAAGPDAGIVYERADLDELSLPPTAFDLAYSSLALHYVSDAARLFQTVHRCLVPGGHFVFSTEHPIYMAPTHPGWSVDAEGRKTWPVDRYLVEGPRKTDWLAKGVVKHHRTIGTTLNTLIRCGFTIEHVEEFRPTDAQIAAKPELAEELDRPMFLLVSARR